MRRGTTPDHIFSFPKSLWGEQIAVMYITYSQKINTTDIEKVMTDFTIPDDGDLNITLSQEETLSLKPGSIRIQIRLRTEAGVVMASDIINTEVGSILKDGEI